MQIDFHKATRFQRLADGTWLVETPQGRVIVMDHTTIRSIAKYLEARIDIETLDQLGDHAITISVLPE
jgi:hypothetical protein